MARWRASTEREVDGLTLVHLLGYLSWRRRPRVLPAPRARHARPSAFERWRRVGFAIEELPPRVDGEDRHAIITAWIERQRERLADALDGNTEEEA